MAIIEESLKLASTFNGYFYYGIVLYQLKEYPKAIKNLDHAIAFAPHNPEPYYYKGMSSLKAGMYEECRDSFLKTLDYEPSNICAANNLAYSYNMLGSYSSAIEC